MNKSYAAGYEYAEELVRVGNVEHGVLVDVDEMTGGITSMPNEDYLSIQRDGGEPNAGDYWNGYNAYMQEAAE